MEKSAVSHQDEGAAANGQMGVKQSSNVNEEESIYNHDGHTVLNATQSPPPSPPPCSPAQDDLSVASPQKKSLGATTALSQKKSLRAKFVPMTTVHEFNSSDPPSKQNEHGEDSELLSPIHEQRQPLLCQLQGNPNNENIDALLQRISACCFRLQRRSMEEKRALLSVYDGEEPQQQDGYGIDYWGTGLQTKSSANDHYYNP
jgi:hypothetical protein